MLRNESDDVAAKLASWRVQPRLPSSFQREVWARIGSRQAEREAAFGRQLWLQVESLFARPAYVFVFAGICLLLGLSVAHQRAEETNAQIHERLETRYVESVSPFLQQLPPSL